MHPQLFKYALSSFHTKIRNGSDTKRAATIPIAITMATTMQATKYKPKIGKKHLRNI